MINMLPLAIKPALSTKPLSMAGLLQLLVSLRDPFFFFFFPRLCFVTQLCSDVILFNSFDLHSLRPLLILNLVTHA